MPMLYMPKFPQLTERIGVYGANGAGKTEVAISMMRRMLNRHFHVFDNNASYEFSIYENDEKNKRVIDAQNFTIYPADATDWLNQKEALEIVESSCEPGDWAIFDIMSLAWESVPGWYTTTFLDLTEMEYRALVRQALEEKRQDQQKQGQKGDRSAPLFDQIRDYQHINPEYKRTVYAMWERLNAKGVHVLATSEAKIVTDKDDKGLRKIYGVGNDRPGGQKGFTGAMNTILHLEHDGDEEFTITTKKDRGSRKAKALDEVEWDGDFAKVYLSPIAGWHMQKVD